MTVVLLLFGLTLLGVAVALGLRAATMPAIDAERRLGLIRAYGFGDNADEFQTARPTGLARLAGALGGLVEGRFAGT